jgi:hypothetical protein
MKIRFFPENINTDSALAAKLDPKKSLFKYKDFKKQLLKDLQKAKKFIGDDPDAEIKFYLSVEHNYLDKEDKPILVVGTPSGAWKNYLKDRIKNNKDIDAIGTLRFVDNEEDENGASFVELSIEKGKAKRKIIKKSIDKWLMPSGVEISFKEVKEITEDLSDTVENNGVMQDKDGQVHNLDPKDKVQALFISLKEGQYKDNPKKQNAVTVKIKTYIDQWQTKYELLSQEQQQSVADKYSNYDFILNWLDNQNEESSDSLGLAGIVIPGNTPKEKEEEKENKNILALVNIGDFGLEKAGKADKIKGTNYGKICNAIELFNKEMDISRKRTLFTGMMGMIRKWIDHHEKDKVSTSKTKKQLAGFNQMYNKYEKFLSVSEDVKLDTEKKSIHKDSQNITGTKTLFDETAGTQKSSEQAKDVRDASIDDRAIRLAELLQRGKADNNDKTFGAVMKWLADNVFNELEDKYIAATKHLFGKKSNLISDIFSVFKAGSLRARYLLDKLKEQESPYAKLAFSLGLMGQTWRDSLAIIGGVDTHIDSTVERDDAMSLIISGYTSDQINTILETTKDNSTFEGAIKEYLEIKHPNMRKQIKAHMDLKKAKDGGNKAAINTANDDYLCSMIHRLRKEGRFGKKLDKNKLLDGISTWLKGASDEERKAMLDEDSKFMRELRDMSGWLSISGIDDGDLAYIREKLSAPQNIPEGKETNAIFDQLKALSAKQAKKNALSRWAQDKDMGQQFKDILFDSSVKDPQKAIVANFSTDAELKRWEEIEVELQNNPVDKEALEAERTEIFGRAHLGLQGLMDKADVHHDIQKEINETIKSNGVKGAVYQEIVRLAKSGFTINFGTDVLMHLNKLEPDSPEFAAIAADKDLIKVLQARTLGNLGIQSNIRQWELIVAELNLKKPYSDTTLSDEDREEASSDNFKRKHRKNRGKLLTPTDIKEQNEQLEEQKKDPKFWAARLAYEYKKGYFSRDEHTLLQTIFEAQKAGNTLEDVLDALKTLDQDAYDYIMEKNKHACRVIRNNIQGNKPIKAIDVLIDSRESVTLKRQVDKSEVVELVNLMSVEDLLKEAFDFDTMKQWVEEKKVLIEEIEGEENEDVRNAKQKALDKLNGKIKRFDISPMFLETIDRVLPSHKAVDIKKQIRFKVGEELMADGENDSKKLFIDLGGFSSADVQLIGADIKAISNIEVQKQSETGLQWSSQSSRMLQRDIAAADYLTKGWERNERLQPLEGFLTDQELEQEKDLLITSLKDAEGKLQEAQKKFEERKKEYDAKLTGAIAALTSAIIFTLSMASGVGAAVGVVQLVWALASTAMTTTINTALKTITSGDRSGTTLEQAEDFFFQALADQAGAVTGLIGANLAFALDVKALGTFSQGMGPDGKPMLTNWENILRTPFLKTAKGVLTSTFNDIGSNFVKNLTDEKDSVLSDPIGGFKDWGINQINSLPRKYLKSLLMTTAATGVGALAKELDWGFLKFHNPDAAGNQYKGDGSDFQSGDARNAAELFGKDNESFSKWYNSWGMFDASPKFGGSKTWDSGEGASSGITAIFSEAFKGLQSPEMRVALANSVIWGTMDGTKGIKQHLTGLVDKAIDSFTAFSGEPIDPDTKKKLQKMMEDSIDESNSNTKQEILEILDAGYGENILAAHSREKIENDELDLNELNNVWQSIDRIGDGNDANNNLKFFNEVATVLGLSENQIKLYRREERCKEFNSIVNYRTDYAANNSMYNRILNNEAFLKRYIDDRSNDGVHPKQIQYTIEFDGKDMTNTNDLENDLNSIYTEWSELISMEAKNIQLIF